MQPTSDEVRLQLDRILASDTFANSDRLRRFLRYVVERALAGEGDHLKEYIIGTEVFDRNEQYDPRIDSIVRVEAGRLRTKVDEYYRRHGVADAVVIRLRRGSYTPVFERQPTASTVSVPAEGPHPNRVKKRTTWHIRLAASFTALLLIAIVAWRIDLWTPREMHSPAITIAVLPFANYSTDEAVRLLAARITDGVTTELARIGTLGVVSHTSARRFADARRPLREVAQELSADVVMEGTLLTDADGVRVEARLVDAKLDRKFWVEYFVGNMTEVRDLQHRIAAAAATAIAGPRPRLYPESIR